MGGAYGSPNFTHLLEAVSYMVLHTVPATMKSEDGTVTRPSFLDEYEPVADLPDNIINDLLLHAEFLKIMQKNADIMTGKALALLSYNNFDVSKTVGVNILKSINSVDYEKIEACMEVGRFYLTLDD